MQVTPVPISDPVNTPWSIRAPTSTSMLGAAAHRAEAAAKPTMASRYARLTPAPSMNGPMASTAMAAASNSTVITHCVSATRPRSAPISGRAAGTEMAL